MTDDFPHHPDVEIDDEPPPPTPRELVLDRIEDEFAMGHIGSELVRRAMELMPVLASTWPQLRSEDLPILCSQVERRAARRTFQPNREAMLAMAERRLRLLQREAAGGKIPDQLAILKHHVALHGIDLDSGKSQRPGKEQEPMLLGQILFEQRRLGGPETTPP